MTTLLVVSALSVLGFAGAFAALGVAPRARAAATGAGAGVSAMLDPALSDDEKERAVQAAGLGLLKSTADVFVRMVATLAAAATPIFGGAMLGLVDAEAVIDFMLGWPFLVATTVLLSLLVWALRRNRPEKAPTSNYSAADQLFHKIAFSGPGAQFAAVRLEDRLFAARIARAAEAPPIFITALPRAGTTVLLNALTDLPETATHLYRDMPWVMAPLLWSRLSGPCARRSDLTERAHGDGLRIGFDSPEAFEEVIWRAFRPEKFTGDRLPLWSADDMTAEAAAFFRAHFRKIQTLRGDGSGRYVSKNNGNIARLALLPAMFPGCAIITPIRDPAEHAASLLRQHLNFGRQHADDPFTERYMRDIGHLEFGRLHKPIDFPGFAPTSGPEAPDYWLDYWIAAYREVERHQGALRLISHQTLCEQPQAAMRAVCAACAITPEGGTFSAHFRPVAATADKGLFDQAKLAEAEALYHTLRGGEIGVA